MRFPEEVTCSRSVEQHQSQKKKKYNLANVVFIFFLFLNCCFRSHFNNVFLVHSYVKPSNIIIAGEPGK